MLVAGACGANLAHRPINFEFLINQESYGFFSVIIGLFIQKNMGLDSKILFLSTGILDAD